MKAMPGTRPPGLPAGSALQPGGSVGFNRGPNGEPLSTPDPALVARHYMSRAGGGAPAEWNATASHWQPQLIDVNGMQLMNAAEPGMLKRFAHEQQGWQGPKPAWIQAMDDEAAAKKKPKAKALANALEEEKSPDQIWRETVAGA